MARLLTRQRMRRNRRKGTAPEYPRVRNLANALCTLPGFGMSSKAIPSNTAVVCYGYNDGSQAPFCDQDTVTARRLGPPQPLPPGQGQIPGRVRVHGHDADHIAQSHNSSQGQVNSSCENDQRLPQGCHEQRKRGTQKILEIPQSKKVLIKYAYKTMRAARNTYMITVCPCLCQKFRFNLPFTLSHLPSCSFPVPCPAA